MIDMGTNTSDVEVRPQRDGTRVITSDDNAQASCLLVNIILPTGVNEQVPMPHINLPISGYDTESLRGLYVRTQDTGIQGNLMILQLDGPVSVPTRDRRRLLEDIRVTEREYSQGDTYLQGASASQRREYPRDSSDDMIGDHIEIKDPLKEGDIKVKMEGHPIEEDTRLEDTLGEDTPIKMGDPLERRPPDGNGKPPDDGGPPDEGEPPGNGRPPRYPGE